MCLVKWRRSSMIAAAAVGVLGLSAISANAGTMTLGNSGWTATWDSSHDSYLDLSVDGVTSQAVYIEKGLNYVAAPDANGNFAPVTITFQQTRVDALPFVAINDESVVNHSGTDWTGFQMSLTNAAFEPGSSNVNQSNGFSIDPFTQYSFTLGDTVLNVSGGTVANGAVWFPGAASGNLFIVAPVSTDPNGLASFTLSEVPVSVIPLPAAFWSGLMGLGGLGLLVAGRKVRRTA